MFLYKLQNNELNFTPLFETQLLKKPLTNNKDKSFALDNQ